MTSFKLDLNKLTVTDKGTVYICVCSTLAIHLAIAVGADAVSILSEMVSQCNVRERFNTDEETWPPNQPKNFMPLLLIHHQGQHTMKQPTAVAQLIQTGDIDEITSLASNLSVPKHHSKLDSHEPLQEILDSSTVTKELAEILAPLQQSKDPQFILIEGAPGIGKSILLKELAYRWGNKQLLKTFKLVLLISLRNPTVQQVASVSDLLQHFCMGNRRAVEIAAACHDYLSENGGKDIMFLFDGFDEYPEKLQENSLIADILKRKILPYCALVVSSRPHATVHLRERSTVRVDILGFTEVEQNQFIQQALKEQPQSIKELTQYLEDHFTIRSLCVVPFNMVVLLFLYKQRTSLPNNSLPDNSTQLYNHFICLTICRHLAKYGHPLDNTITDLTSLPDPCSKIIQQLSEFSLEALNNNKLVFTFDEIKVACPDIVAIPGAINGFGLLQAVQHFGLTGKTMTFNFLHFTIQEFLAAHRLAGLSPRKELKILKEKFWSDIHSNMFAIYISLTKGQRPTFKQFIKPSLRQRLKGFLTGEQLENRFLEDNLKCFRLFRCFSEAGDNEMCRSIENAKSVKGKKIKINDPFSSSKHYIRLSPSDVECVTVFLTCSSNKEWEELELWKCYIQDHGVHILHRGLTSCDVTITTLDFDNNGLTESSSSAISDITISCRVKVLDIRNNNTVGEDERLYSIISDPSSLLEELNIIYTKLSSSGAIKLFTALSEGKKLGVLDIGHNDITDEACDAIIMAMKKNNSLVRLYMYDNPISTECAQLIVQALQHNNTLQDLWPPSYSYDVNERIRLSAEEVNKMRESRNCQVKLKIHW